MTHSNEGDHQVITTRRAAAAAAAAVVLLAGCSSTDDAESVADRSAATSSSTRSSTVPVANRATTEACRSLADNKNLAAFWKDINNTGITTGARGMLAGMAVMKLGLYIHDPAVDPTVSAAMSTAVTEMGNMNDESAHGEPFDVERFRNIITPVVTACQQAGVDMAIPE